MIKLQQKGRCLPADTQTPVSLYLDLIGRKQGILLESSEVDGRLGKYSLLAWDFRLRLESVQGKLKVEVSDPRLQSLKEFEGLDFVQGLRRVLQAIEIVPPEGSSFPAMTRSLCGYLGYGLVGLWEPKLRPVLPPSDAEAVLVLPGKVLLFEHLYHHCFLLSLDDDLNLPRPKSHSKERENVLGPIQTYPDRETFKQSVAEVKELIRQGEAIQVVLSVRFAADFSGDPFQVYRHLRQINPSPYTFYMHLGEITLLGSSPELMVKCEGNKLQLRPIAGTRPRGKDKEEDERLSEDLLQDEKERAEHVMLVDLGRNDLGRIAQPGSVEVDKFMQVERFSHVMHLTSYLSANLKPGLDALDVIQATFPAGTVSGAPKIRAMEIISQFENLPRGPYAGAIGWIGLDKDKVNMDTGITIRSLWVRDGKIYWQAGAGVVFDSDPDKEWQECQNKARAINKAITSTGGTDDFAHRQL
ncbi:anthranilate synthase component I family protein [Desulfohalobiaceae bacterium Ax17]|uniref:anthranilate synthase component I family protein n=1 Tax=Desulfovulcanus ferrireducens TaxID=2831190 RepID=UPI00207BC22D|nr:anthranilate synthase component I family protein [Desulfovulcanus ferrireducens]MBT8762618.1 anthranilate synthase component I family protein [Desulfovulcanus ferrireducens]